MNRFDIRDNVVVSGPTNYGIRIDDIDWSRVTIRGNRISASGVIDDGSGQDGGEGVGLAVCRKAELLGR